MLNSEFKTCYITCNGPLQTNKQPKRSTTDKSIMGSFNRLLLLISLCDMSQGIGSFPIVRSASISSHVATRRGSSAFLSGTCGTQEILFWGSTALLNASPRGENTMLGLIVNTLLNEPKSDILGVLCKEVWLFFLGEGDSLYHISWYSWKKAEKLLDPT